MKAEWSDRASAEFKENYEKISSTFCSLGEFNESFPGACLEQPVYVVLTGSTGLTIAEKTTQTSLYRGELNILLGWTSSINMRPRELKVMNKHWR